MAGGELRLGTASIYMTTRVTLFCANEHKSTTLHGYILSSKHELIEQNQALESADRGKFSLGAVISAHSASFLLREIGPQEVSACNADPKWKIVRSAISEPLLPTRGQSLVPIVCGQECNHTSDGSLNEQIVIGRSDTGQPHENVAVWTRHDYRLMQADTQ